MLIFYRTLFACSETIAPLEKQSESIVDLQQIELTLNLLENTGTANISLFTTETEITLQADNIIIQVVQNEQEQLSFSQTDGLLSFQTEANTENIFIIAYEFPERTLYEFDGWMPNQGVSFIWPDHCGNLYPCNPNTEDGIRFSVKITEAPQGATVIAPEQLIPEAPPYMPAFAMGDYTKLEVGTTQTGIDVFAWYLDGEDGLEDAQWGVLNMIESINFLEETYGTYAFGDKIGAVEVDWGSDSYGGMEHHPYFHVGQYDFWNEETQIHEVAHGWFGNAVRLQCWEDFVLSEGTVTYMTAKTLQEVAGYDLWEYYVEEFLEPICQGEDYNAIVMPSGCNDIDFENDNLWSLATYMKGACFYEEAGDILGEAVIDQIIGEFYTANKYRPAKMEDMIELIYKNSNTTQRIEIEQAIQDWLLSYECPADYANRCRFRDP